MRDCITQAMLFDPGAYVAKVNRLVVRPEYMRIQGLTFEEYLIEAVTD